MTKKNKILILILLGGFMSISSSQLARASDGFTIRTGVNVSHWLSQSQKRGDARRMRRSSWVRSSG